ncbi:hypothetical protein ACEQPO_22225 [Bacillus sp. SL00103]
MRPEEGPVAPKQPVFEQHKEYKKIEDTKVYYEYPTGNFRFRLFQMNLMHYKGC